MKLLVMLGLLGLMASVASAQVVDIAWNDFGPSCSAGERLMTFDCSTNAASEDRTFVTSFVSPTALPQFVGITVVLDILTDGGTLPPWWQAGSGECRSGAFTEATPPSVAGLEACADPWGDGFFLSVMHYKSGGVAPDRARFICDLAIAEARPIEAGVRYYAQHQTLRVHRSTGAEACEGCQVGACIVLNRIELYQVVGSPGGDIITLTPAGSPENTAFLAWQGPVAHPEACGPLPTPVARRSWGQIKGIYR